MRGSLVKGSFWISAARTSTNLIGLVSNIVLARILVPADFGIVALGTSMLAIVSSLTELSLSSALVHHDNPTPDHYNTAWTLNAIRGSLVAVLFAACAPGVARLYHEPRLLQVMMALAIGALLGSLGNPRTVMLQKQLVFWQQFMLQVSQKLVGLVVSISVALMFRSYWALIAGLLCGQFASLLVSYTVLPFRPSLSLRHARELFSFSVWLSLGQVLNTINWRFDQLVIGGWLGRSALGFYTVGDNLAVIPSREATVPLTGTLFPAFARLADDRGRLAAAYQAAQSLVTAIALPVGVGMALIAEPLIRLTMGEKWLPAVLLIQVLASVYAFQTLGTLSQPLAMAAGETRLLFKRDAQSFVLRIPLLLVGLYVAGLPGIVYMRAFAGSSAVLLHMQVVKKVTGLTFASQLAVNLRSLTSVCVMAAMVIGCFHSAEDPMTSTELALRIGSIMILGAITYITAHSLLWLTSGRPTGPESEILALWSKIRNRLRPAESK